jgi:hypothetical protein
VIYKLHKHKNYQILNLYAVMNVLLWYFAKIGSEIKWKLVSTPWQLLLHFIDSERTVTSKPSLGKTGLGKKLSISLG